MLLKWLLPVVSSQWAVINELEKLRALVQLSCKQNPLMDLEKNREVTRQLVIACISQLEILDRTEVCGIEPKKPLILRECRRVIDM